MNRNKSEKLFEEAKGLIPGGVNSPVRAFKSVGGSPVFFSSGSGAEMTDVDGNTYIDYIGSWGPHIFGHNPPFIIDAIKNALTSGISFGAPTSVEVEMAKMITSLVPSVEMVRMVNSGTEATMSAIRAARGYTKREKIIKFEGCYHGHADYFLIKAGSGALTLGVPSSPGVTEGNAKDTLVAQFNDLSSVKSLVEANKGMIAAVIIEPVVGNMGVVIPEPDFMYGLRKLCTDEGIVLIFDEVMTGFRLSQSGAQGVFNIIPDLSTFGKVIGGGMPVGAFGGKKEIMSVVAPAGPVYQAGTLSGNPLALSAGLAALTHIKNNPGIYAELDEKGKTLEEGLKDVMRKLNLNYTINRIGSMVCLFFTTKPVKDFVSAVSSDTVLYGNFFHEMLNRGIYLPPAQFEAYFISTAHTGEQLEATLRAAYESLSKLS